MRAAASAVAWLLYGAGLVELVRGILSVGAVGGYCASGGPFQITVECPDGAGLRIVGGAAAIVAAVILDIAVAGGVGPDLPVIGIPVLFGMLGALFLAGAVPGPRFDLLLPGVAFFAMALAAIGLTRENGALRTLVGSRGLDGAVLTLPGRAVYRRNLPRDRYRQYAPAVGAVSLAVSLPPIAVGAALGLVL